MFTFDSSSPPHRFRSLLVQLVVGEGRGWERRKDVWSGKERKSIKIDYYRISTVFKQKNEIEMILCLCCMFSLKPKSKPQ